MICSLSEDGGLKLREKDVFLNLVSLVWTSAYTQNNWKGKPHGEIQEAHVEQLLQT